MIPTTQRDVDARARRRFLLALSLLTLVAWLLREYFVLATVVEAPIRGDVRAYVAYAWNLLHHGVFSMASPSQAMPTPDGFRGPGYPLVLAALRAYPFPGNVRELENILERALALADGDLIEAADLRLPAPTGSSSKPSAAAPAPAPAVGADPRTLDPRDTASSRLPEYMEQLERDAIQQALVENRYNKTRAAQALGITFRALRYKLKKLGID